MTFEQWLRQQPSCLSRQFSEFVDGQGRCEFAHVRRVKRGAGVGIKPPDFGVPLTHEEHAMQHNKGEAYTLAAHGIITDNATQWFETQAQEYYEKWQSLNEN